MVDIEVKPSDNLFKELGNNTYSYLDLLSELIDNSIAARFSNKILNIIITIGKTNNNILKYIEIRDDAKGISLERLGDAISPGAIQSDDSLNEHGLGMKQAIASLGELDFLITKTKSSDKALKIRKFKWGSIPVKEEDVEWSYGTIIRIKNLKPIVESSNTTYSKTISSYLGARYRYFLKEENPLVNLEINMVDVENSNQIINKWLIKEIKPIYFHPNTRLNKPVVERKKFSGNEWEAELTFGYAPTDVEYADLGISQPPQYSPYNVSLSKQGLDIIRFNRVILFSQLSEIGLVNARHNQFNYIRGEIFLIKGFCTAITKNSMIMDDNFIELINQIKNFLTNKSRNYLKFKTWNNEISDGVMRNRLANHLKKRTIDPKKEVDINVQIGNLSGLIDIIADGEIYKLKTKQANGLDVYQLFAYLDMGPYNKGYYIAPDFTLDADDAVQHIKNKHKKDILLVKTSEFPITHPLEPNEL